MAVWGVFLVIFEWPRNTDFGRFWCSGQITLEPSSKGRVEGGKADTHCSSCRAVSRLGFVLGGRAPPRWRAPCPCLWARHTWNGRWTTSASPRRGCSPTTCRSRRCSTRWDSPRCERSPAGTSYLLNRKKSKIDDTILSPKRRKGNRVFVSSTFAGTCSLAKWCWLID